MQQLKKKRKKPSHALTWTLFDSLWGATFFFTTKVKKNLTPWYSQWPTWKIYIRGREIILWTTASFAPTGRRHADPFRWRQQGPLEGATFASQLFIFCRTLPQRLLPVAPCTLLLNISSSFISCCYSMTFALGCSRFNRPVPDLRPLISYHLPGMHSM